MPQRRYALAFAALVAVGSLTVGCDLAGFRVQIPDFNSRMVEGMWVWRQTSSGKWERFAQLEFGQPTRGQDGKQYLPYNVRGDGLGATLQTEIFTPPGAPAAANLQLGFV